MPTPRKLKNLQVTRVALVDAGANPDADILIWKAKEVRKGLMMNDLREKLRTAVKDRENPGDDEYVWVDDVDLDESNAIYSRDDRYYRVSFSLDADDNVALTGDSEEVEREVTYTPTSKGREPQSSKEAPVAEATKKAADDLQARVDELEAEQKALTDMSNDDLAALKGFEIAKAEPKEEDVLKSLPEDVRKRLEDAETRVAKMESERRAEQFIRKARDEFGDLAPAEEFGPVLEEIDRLAPDAAKTLDTLLKAVAARAETSQLFKELGKSEGESTDDPVAKVREKAAAIRKADASVDLTDAVARVLRENPELADAWASSTK